MSVLLAEPAGFLDAMFQVRRIRHDAAHHKGENWME